MNGTYTHLRNLDINHIWHPYTNIDKLESNEIPIIASAQGCNIYDSKGNSYIDGISSWWCVNFGHSHPELVSAIRNQASKLQNVILGGMSHEKAILLSEKLASMTPKGLKRSFFASDGSSAIEAALRISLQYWNNIGYKNKKKFICLEGGYHGDTLGAVSVGYIDHFHRSIKDVLINSYKARSPHCIEYNPQSHIACDLSCFKSMESLLYTHCDEVAAVILEPICQGAAGIKIYPEQYLTSLRDVCNKCNVLLIADEIAVGFARTGSMFASEKAGITPDILVLGKGLTGGYLPMSVAHVSEKIYDTFRNDNTFFYGHTYSGNPIASALALRALELYQEEQIIARIKPLETLMDINIKKLSKLLPNSFSQSIGLIAMIKIHKNDGGIKRAEAIGKAAMSLGLFIRPLGDTVYIWPPLIISPNTLIDIFDILKHSVEIT